MKPPSREHSLGRLQQALIHAGSVRKAAKEVNMNEATARRWLAQASRPAAAKSVRKGALTASQQKAAFDMLSHASAGEVAVRLQQEKIVERTLHKSTVIRAAQAYATSMGIRLRYRQGPPTKELSPQTKAKRVAFAKKNANTNWRRVLFTDRKKFAFNYPGVKVNQGKWLKGKEVHEVARVSHAYTVNIYCGLSPAGLTMSHEVAGTKGLKSTFVNKKGQMSRNITAAEYENVMRKTLLPEGRRLFSISGIASWVFQQDNDPSHKDAAKHLKAWNTKHRSSISLLDIWPPNSPDLNPIENVWAWMDAKIQAEGCKDFKAFKASLKKIGKEIPKSMLKNLYASMPKRLALVMEREGGKTGY